MRILRQPDREGYFDGRHDGPAIGVDEIQRELVLAFVIGGKRGPQRHGALQLHGRHLRRENGVKRAEDIELTAAVLGCSVTEDGDLNIHVSIQT